MKWDIGVDLCNRENTKLLECTVTEGSGHVQTKSLTPTRNDERPAIRFSLELATARVNPARGTVKVGQVVVRGHKCHDSILGNDEPRVTHMCSGNCPCNWVDECGCCRGARVLPKPLSFDH